MSKFYFLLVVLPFWNPLRMFQNEKKYNIFNIKNYKFYNHKTQYV